MRDLVPDALAARAALGPDRAHWLTRLPRLTRDLLQEWDCRPDGPAWHGHCSLVLPVRTAAGVRAVLKVGFDGDEESVHEALVLQHWNGDGAVRLLTADPRRRALLLERLTAEAGAPVDLGQEWDLAACEIVAGLYRRLHRPALPHLARLTDRVDRWLADLAAAPRDLPVPRRFVEQALHVGADLTRDAGPAVLLHGDLHYANVLAAERAPWLAIDPKPLAGEAAWEPAPMLWNRWEDLAGDVRGGLRRRFHTLVDAADLDEGRARDWVVVRMVLNAHWAVADAQAAGRDLTADERAWISRCIALVKAVQD